MTMTRSIEPVLRCDAPRRIDAERAVAETAFPAPTLAPSLVAAFAENRRLGDDLERSLSGIRATLAAMAFAEERVAVGVAPLARELVVKLSVGDRAVSRSLSLRLANGPLAGTLLTVTAHATAFGENPQLDVLLEPATALAAALLVRYRCQIESCLMTRLTAYTVGVRVLDAKGERKNARA